jgi:diguanylate cyclase (GGDEF)-like protein
LPALSNAFLAGSVIRPGESLNLFFFEIENYFAMSSLFGERFAARIVHVAHEALERMIADSEWLKDTRLMDQPGPGQFLLLCGPESACCEDLSDRCTTMRLLLKGRLKSEARGLTGEGGFDLLAGASVLSQYGDLGPEAALYNALCQAQRMARGQYERQDPGVLREFMDIVETPLIRPVYQPIVNLSSGRIFAWEALVRGPENSVFQSPTALFDYAEDIGEIFMLEKRCREAAIGSFGPFQPGQKLFLNIHPKTMVDPAFSPGETRKLLDRAGLSPEDVVFEITERHAIRDFTLFYETLAHYRNQGYMVAVDDVGTGYSGLASIAEIRPDFLKIDMSFVRGIDSDPVKRALVETFVTFAEKIGCKIIAEGIETPTELSSLMSMNTHFGQGFHLSRPAFPKPQVDIQLPAWSLRRSSPAREVKCSIPVSEVAEPPYQVPPGGVVREVRTLCAGEEAISALAVTDDGKPVGLVMSHHLDRALSSQYGMSLYYHRTVDRIMDASPLVVDERTPVEVVAKRAMNRERSKIYDHILVTRAGKLTGIVSVQKMLDTLAAVQVEMAKGANPLTGLPGNLSIEREIEARASAECGFTIVYADLDNFKVYNDIYGFKHGDNIILLLARILAWAVRKHGGESSFLGHVGGDDFVGIVPILEAERICLSVTRCFKRLAPGHYNEQDRARGMVVGKDRNGVEREFPLVSVSLAMVDCGRGCSLGTIAQRSAEMKKFAKTIEGNSFVRDRRGPVEE